ncbi:uroporphyrinogen-III C-methyltransferase [Candidatus Endobugula sertula]|uniref:Siroheme synthase n=1 Tax=Candidatus Endobugula sertula TaxID=62101 RepID=A0A1D2QTP5_9GAMM|nr:uroporphyrinogen-III C-methyltransferase [Candidatus Endobugula sertula]
MNYMPFFFNLKNRPCLIVGGGSIATRKARLLEKAGAKLMVVAPYISAEMQELITRSGGKAYRRIYQCSDLKVAEIVIGATDDKSVNEQVSREAQAKKLPVNIVDSPELCSIITPIVVDRSPLMIAITSGGDAPVLARKMREKLETLFPSNYGLLAQLASRFRHRVKQHIPAESKRLRFWEKVFSGTVAEKVFAGKINEAEQVLESLLSERDDTVLDGEVYLVGGGPGDPDLLTFKALRLMQQSDVVLYDRLVSEKVLNLVRRDAERIYVGKKSNDHAVPQQAINQLLVDLAKQGKRVLRLKGGDPFIFGRGGEEIELLAENQISFQVVPGITAASGCSAYAGIPLTHRDYAQSVRFITGHTKSDKLSLPWEALVEPKQTLVFYMGLANLQEICDSLIRYGRATDTPVALVEKGTTPEQRVHTATLSTLSTTIESKGVHAPTLLIVGGVVSLRDQLTWFESDKNE